MKAMVLEAPNTPFILKEVPDPLVGAGEAIAKVFACGSGLTDPIDHDCRRSRQSCDPCPGIDGCC